MSRKDRELRKPRTWEQLFTLLNALDYHIDKTRSGHFRVVERATGRVIRRISGTPSDSRALQNTISQLRHLGVRIPRK